MTRARVSLGRQGRSTSRPMTNSRWARRSRRQRRRVCRGDDDGRWGGELHLPGDGGIELHGDVQRVRTGAEPGDLRHGGAGGDGGSRAGVDGDEGATPALVLVVGGTWSGLHDPHDRGGGMGRRRRRSTSVTYCRRGRAPTERSRRRAGPGGCPASGATSLAGCTVCGGHQWPSGDPTVPVAVAANAANPTVNTATVTGGGDPTCTNCVDDDEPGD